MRSGEEARVEQKKELRVSEYSAGDYFPKEALSECLPFNIIADSPCEVISIPKRCLKALNWSPATEQPFRGEEYYRTELAKQESWQSFKQEFLTANLNFRTSKPKPMIF